MIQAVVVVNGARYPVPPQGQVLRIGRAPENDIVLPDPNISRQHLVVMSTPRGPMIQDLNSQNGTYIGGRRIGREPEPIPTGARVRIGVTEIQVELVRAADPDAATVGGRDRVDYPRGSPGGSVPPPGGRPAPFGDAPNGSGPATPYGGAPGPYAGAARANAGSSGRAGGGGSKTGLVVGGIIAVLIVAMVGTGALVLRAVADSRVTATPTPTPRPILIASTATPAPPVTTGPAATAKPAVAATTTPASKPAAAPAIQVTPTVQAAPATPTAPPEQPKPAGGRDPAFVRALNSSVRVIVQTGPSSAITGSGSVISSKGHILTNYHVVSDDAGKLINRGENVVIAVPPNEGDAAQPKYRAKVAEADTKLDLAVLQVVAMADGSALPASPGLNPIPIGSSKSVNIGDTIIIIGFPGLGGSSLTVTRGIHSGIARFSDDPGTFIKTDTEINRGNSGGTAINAAGELIGIPTAGRFDRDAPGKIGLVRPIDEAKPLIDKYTH